jgi:hypothetical protein
MKKGVYKRNKKILGIGINDSNYVTQTYKIVDGKRVKDYSCPYYMRWYDMLKRVTGRVNINGNSKSYDGVAICEEWTYFSNFKSWMEQQDWEGKHLDKDLLSKGEKIYSPETCCFVDRSINNFLIDRGAFRGDCALGVAKMKKQGLKKAYKCDISKYGERERLGYFETEQEAHKAWQLAKWKYGQELLQEQTDPRVIQAMHVILHKLGEDWSLGRITEKLV